ncbi:MAG: hypothetical protein K9G34_05785 [Melioribacteraceae bacterium]|nr:hypothetical protein [Melioribacteraceae bacterium]MCF8431438.1 hypothetical protein [Melioribacteraceae bacterium]
MLAKKKKLSKKEIKEDQLVTSYYQSLEFIEQYKSKLIIAAAAIAVVVLAVLLYTNKIEEDNTAANEALSRVIPLYDNNQFEQAINGQPGTTLIGLKEIVDQYSGTTNGEIAKFYLANSYFFTGEYQSALEVYQDFNGDDELLRAGAISGSANCYEALGQNEKAAELYYQASQVSEYNPDNAENLLLAGKNYLTAGQNEKSAEVLNELKANYKTSASAREADRYLAEANMM